MNSQRAQLRLRLHPRLIAVFVVMVLAGMRAHGAEAKPLYPGITPVIAPEALKNLSLSNTTIESVDADAAKNICMVTAIVTHPPAGDHVTVWIGLPLTNWNGRFLGTGGGGFLGGSSASLRVGVLGGFVTGATDTGHPGGSGSFALDSHGQQNWQGIIDNAYLGIHEMTVIGQALTKAFYGQPPRYSYFVGGSTGGRQGLMEAQRYPDDYNGIISMCPAINWTRFVPAALWPEVVMRVTSNYVSKAKLDAVTAAAVAACDADDGVKDGVIDDPLHCTYDPQTFVGTPVGDETFTAADAEVVRQMWQGPRAPDGSFIWYGLERGADLSAYAATTGSPLHGNPFGVGLEYWVYYLAQDPKWDWQTLTYAGFYQLWQKSVKEYGAVLATDNPDLTRFRDHGGKIIIYHGLADQLVPVAGTIEYYQHVQKRMGGRKKTAAFARVFLVPGVDHGMHGAGATPTGVNEAILNWVEEGQAPDRLLAEKRDATGKVIRTRVLFPYPQVAKYTGTGSPDDAANFVAH